MEDIINIVPPGVRFHPFDEEVIYYVDQKTMNPTYNTSVMKEVNLNSSEPWVLLGMMEVGEKEIYVFGQHGRKYTTGSRIDRSTEYGFWKTTGKDKKILRGEELIGKRSTLVFYTGRAPHGVKTNWVMNEFRTERSNSTNPCTQNEWVVARISYTGIMDGSERRNPFQKHSELESAIMPAPVPESPILLAPVPDSRAWVQDLPDWPQIDESSWFDVGATSSTYLYSEIDYPQTPSCLNKYLEVMEDLPPLTDKSEFAIEDWFVVLGNEKENEKEMEMGGFD